MSDTVEDQPGRSELPSIWILALLVAVFAVYAPSLGNGFAMDDKLVAHATRPNGEPNRMVAEVRPLAEYFRSGYWGGESGRKTTLYRPVTILSYAVTNSVFGDSALPHHLINILLHVWAVYLAFRLLARVTTKELHALMGAAVFGLHAIHSEVVAGIVGRAELLAFCLGAQALLLLFPPSGSRGILWSAAAAALLFLSFCSKESALAWAPFLAVYAIVDDLVGRRRITGGRILAVVAIALPTVVAFVLLRHHAVGDITPVIHYYANPLAHADTATRICTGVTLWAYGLFKCTAPFRLLSDYGPATFELVESIAAPRFLLSCAVLTISLTAGIVAARRHPLVLLAVACFLGFGFVTSNLPFAIGTIFGERLYFTPSLALGIFAAWIASRTGRRWTSVLLAVWILANCWIILARNGAWASDAALFSSDVDNGTRCVRVLDQHALQLRDGKQPAEAEKLWRRAIELDPQYPDALFNLASHLGATQRYGEAETLFLAAIAVPDVRSPRRHIYRRDLSVLYELTNRMERSVEQLRLAWQEDSAYDQIWGPLVERTLLHLPGDEIQRIIATGKRRSPGRPIWELLGAFVTARSMITAGRRADAVTILERLDADSRAPAYIRELARRLLR